MGDEGGNAIPQPPSTHGEEFQSNEEKSNLKLCSGCDFKTVFHIKCKDIKIVDKLHLK